MPTPKTPESVAEKKRALAEYVGRGPTQTAAAAPVVVPAKRDTPARLLPLPCGKEVGLAPRRKSNAINRLSALERVADRVCKRSDDQASGESP